MMEKSPDAFRTISEVADVLDTPAHVLRFWETRFPQIKPVKRAGGRRYYRPSDVALLEGIKRLLHSDGMTIRGVQKVLREQGVRHVAGLAEEPSDEEVALEVALADIDHEAPVALEPPAAEDATVTVLQDAIARLRDGLPPPAPPVQQSLWETTPGAAQPVAEPAPPPAPARAADATEIPKGPTIAARLRGQRQPLADDRLPGLQARLVALRNQMAAAGRPGGF
ncbi:MAG: MerR family transcriptional regulator [Paracoccaceae bacterium]